MKGKFFGIIVVTAVLGVVLTLAACSNGAANAQGTGSPAATGQGGTYSPVSITPTISGDNVSIPAATVNSSKNVEFNVKFDQGTASYMAYY